MTSKLTSDERLVKILSETQATIMEHNSRCVRGSVEVDARLFESMIMELQERRKAAMDSEPVAWRWRSGPNAWWQLASRGDIDGEVEPLYRHAQPAPEKYNIGDTTMRHIFTPTGMTNVSNMQAVFDRVEAVLVGMEQPSSVVPEEKPMPNPLSMYAVDAVAAIAEAKGWNACRAAMLQAGNSPVIPDGYVMVPKEPTQAMCAAFNDSDYGRKSLRERYVAMLAAAPQEVK